MRQAFREYLVGTVLAYIDDIFTGAGIAPGPLPEGFNFSGARRTRVEEFYAGVDWSDPADLARVLTAFERVLDDAEQAEAEKLRRQLVRDGFVVDADGRISPQLTGLDALDRTTLSDPDSLARYERRMRETVAKDPEAALGAAKELTEAVLKLLCDDAGVEVDMKWSLEKLFKVAAGTLDLDPAAVPDSKAGAESIRKALRGLNQTVVGIDEIRNRFGTGHGRPRMASGLGPRHARLAVGAATTLVNFLLETRAARPSGRAERVNAP